MLRCEAPHSEMPMNDAVSSVEMIQADSLTFEDLPCISDAASPLRACDMAR